jgi:hypothetical protein
LIKNNLKTSNSTGSLGVSGGSMKDKVWEIEYEGSLIRIINKISLIPPKTSEVLIIDDVEIEIVKGSFLRMDSTITSCHRFNDKEKNIEIRIAQKKGGFGTGAQLYIDGEFVGGDKSIQYLDPEKTLKQYQNGYMRYFFTVGLLNFGLPYALMMSFLNSSDPIVSIALTFIFQATFFGGIMSYLSWRNIKSRCQKP